MATKTTAVKSKKASTTNLRAIKVPKIGQRWKGQGGVFVGLMPGKKDYALILGRVFKEQEPWQAHQDRAAALVVDGHKDFRCPTRKELALLFATVAGKFETRDWYWSNERCAGNGAMPGTSGSTTAASAATTSATQASGVQSAWSNFNHSAI